MHPCDHCKVSREASGTASGTELSARVVKASQPIRDACCSADLASLLQRLLERFDVARQLRDGRCARRPRVDRHGQRVGQVEPRAARCHPAAAAVQPVQETLGIVGAAADASDHCADWGCPRLLSYNCCQDMGLVREAAALPPGLAQIATHQWCNM